jgi:hypothetical protein
MYEGLDAKIVAGVQTQGSALVVLPELVAEYEGPISLKGKTIATFPPGSIQHTVLSKWFLDNGIDPEREVNLKAMGPSEATTAISWKAVDAVFLPCLYPTIIEVAGNGVIVEWSGSIWPNHACCCVVASGEMIREHPEMLEQIIKTHIRATEYEIAHPDEAAEIFAQWHGADVSTIKRSINVSDMQWIHDPHLEVESGIKYAAVIYDLNRERYEGRGVEVFEEEAIFDTSFYDEIQGISPEKVLDVPFFSQRDPVWCDKKLDHSPYSIGEYGCALTSAAMVSKYFGYDTDPDRLNTSLTEVGGLDASGILHWEKVDEVSDGKVEWIGWVEGNWSKIDQELSNKNPVIADVSCPLGNHFIVFIGKIGTDYYFLDPYDENRTANKWPNGAHGEYTLNNLRIYHGSPTTLREGDVVGRKVKIGFEHSHASYIDFDEISILSNSLNYSGIAYEHYDMVKPTIELNQFDGTLTKDKTTANITFQLNQNPEAIVFSIFQKVSGSYADLKLSITDPNGKRYWWICIPPNRITTLHFHAPIKGEWNVESTVDEEYWDQIDCLNFNITLYGGKNDYSKISNYTAIAFLWPWHWWSDPEIQVIKEYVFDGGNIFIAENEILCGNLFEIEINGSIAEIGGCYSFTSDTFENHPITQNISELRLHGAGSVEVNSSFFKAIVWSSENTYLDINWWTMLIGFKTGLF